MAAGYRKYETFAGSKALLEVANERIQQTAKWGEQNHQNGTGPETYPLGEMDSLTYAELGEDEAVELAAVAKLATDKNARRGSVTWKDILLEEVFEALAEADHIKLKAELIQVAAVAVQWVEAIERSKP
ncbi:hypothetical protein NIBR502771_02140 [Pseudarthrobacter sp. NIBRBAC000502771]|nr:hypothetical protein NIBR502771_02140 [Pseudarthrobacter sp. NIBRBAC000502771]